MKIKKIFILIIIAILVLSVIVVIIYVNNFAKLNNGLFKKLQSPSSCARLGERVRASGADFPAKCCSNLKAMYGYAREDCNVSGLPGDIGTCSNCGNGICEAQNNENKCNCREDCK